MKTHTSDFKNTIKTFGRELDSKITYTIGGTTTELGNEQLNSVTPHYEGGILKSVMKQLDIDSNVEIPVGTILTYQFGVKVGNSYEYISYGNYVVKEVEKQEDTMSYKITCYDKMLYSMVDYENLNITYPITIRNYISAICTKLGLTFKNASSTFANYNKQITKELYLDENGKSLGYTYRDVLDELAQVTASTICINENDDELEIRYINNTNDTIDEEYLKDVNVNFGEKYGPVNTIVLSRSAGADNIYYPSTLPQNPIEIKISDNQIMNGNDRDTYMVDIYNKLNGLEYYINDFSSTGICYYNLCDKYNVSIDGTTYSCVMFNDEINITQGLEENIYTEMPKESVTNYKKSDTTDRRINQTTLIVDKQQQEITALVDTTQDIQKEINPTDNATGSSIYLEDSTDAELVNFEMEGKTTQETSTQGANLFDENYYRNATYSTDVYKYTLSKITGNSGVLYTKAQLKSGKTKINGLYICLCSKNNPNISGAVYSWFMYNSDLTASTKSINTSGLNELYFSFYPTNISINDIFDNYDFWVSTNDIDYVPFVPDMPSPDYPSKLVSVGDGNLFDNKFRQGAAYNLTATNRLYSQNDILVEQGKEYTISTNIDTNVYRYAINISQTIHPNGVQIQDSGWKTVSSFTFTANLSGFLGIPISKIANTDLSLNDIEGVWFRVEEGDKVNNYNVKVNTTGKNSFSFRRLGANATYENNILSISSSGVDAICYSNFFIPKGDRKYFFSYTSSYANPRYYIAEYGENYRQIRSTPRSSPSIITIGNDAKYFAIIWNFASSTTFPLTISNMQLEKGTQATTYEPYKSNTYLYTLNEPLRAIGNYKDKLYIDNGMLYVERKIGSVVLNGSEGWTFSSNGNGWYTPVNDIFRGSVSAIISRVYSNYFTQTTRNNIANVDYGVATSNNTNVTFKHKDYVTSGDKSSWLAWLSAHNVELDYILSASVIEELGEVNIPSTYKGITYIDTTDELEPNMSIEYVRDTQITDYVEEHIAQIVVKEDNIIAEVMKKVDNDEIIAKLNLAIEDGQGIIDLIGNQVTIDSDYFKLTADGRINSTGGIIGGYKIGANQLYAETFSPYNFTQTDLDKMIAYIMGTGTLTDEEKEKYDLNGDGSITSADILIMKFYLLYHVTTNSSAKIIMQTGNNVIDNAYILQDGAGNEILNIGFNGIRYKDYNITDKRYAGESIRVIMSDTQTISRNTTTKVNIDTIDYNTSTALTYSNNSVVIGKGVSSILVNCRYTAWGANSGGRYIYIYKNNDIVAFNNRAYSNTMETTIVIPVQENDYIEMYCYNEQSDTFTISNTDSQTFLQVTILG